MAYQIVSWFRPKLSSNCPWGEEIENFILAGKFEIFQKNIYSTDNGFKLMLAWHTIYRFITRVDSAGNIDFLKNDQNFCCIFSKNQNLRKKKFKNPTYLSSPNCLLSSIPYQYNPFSQPKSSYGAKKSKNVKKTTFHAHFRPKSTTHNVFSEKRHQSFRLISKSFRWVGKISERSDLQFSRTWLFLQEKNKR